MFPTLPVGRSSYPGDTRATRPPARDTEPALSPDLELIHAANYADEADFQVHLDYAQATGMHLDLCDVDGKNLLEIAVERNSAAMVKALLAHGAPLPTVGEDGFDLLMQASYAGNLEIVTALLTGGGMVADAVDASGQTALHYAVRSGSTDIIELLFDHGADGGALAFNIADAELTQMFGPHHGLVGEGIPPLSIAVAQNDLRSVKLLLSQHPKIPSSMRNPLWVAIQGQNAPLLVELMDHCLRTRQPEVMHYSLLHAAIIRSPHAQLLRVLLDYLQDLPAKPAALAMALHTAITTGHFDQANELIKADALAEASPAALDMLWTAAMLHQDATAIELLTVSRDESFRHLLAPSPEGHPNLFSRLCLLASDTRALAEHGLFKSAVLDILPHLHALAGEINRLTPAQLAVKTAHLLFKDSPAPAPANAPMSTSQTNAPPPPASTGAVRTLIAGVEAERQRDIDQLAAYAMEKLMVALTDALSPDTLQRRYLSAGEDGVVNTLMEDLRVKHGVSNFIAQSLVGALADARDLLVTGYGHPDINAIARLAELKLYCTLQSAVTDEGSVSDFCKKFLIESLAASRLSLQTLIRQPITFIRTLEQRRQLNQQGWVPLATALTQSTGLPRALCQTLAVCWHNANIGLSHQDKAEASAHQTGQVERSFAMHWKHWQEANANLAGTAALPLTPAELQQLTDWCNQALAVPPVSRKRPAESESADAPPPKPPRQN